MLILRDTATNRWTGEQTRLDGDRLIDFAVIDSETRVFPSAQTRCGRYDRRQSLNTPISYPALLDIVLRVRRRSAMGSENCTIQLRLREAPAMLLLFVYVCSWSVCSRSVLIYSAPISPNIDGMYQHWMRWPLPKITCNGNRQLRNGFIHTAAENRCRRDSRPETM